MYSEWFLEPIFDSKTIVVVMVAVLVLLLPMVPVYRRQTPFRRNVLLGLRLFAILIVLLAMLRPTWHGSSKKPQMATALVLLDVSMSMQQPSTGNKTRWEHQLDTLRRAESRLASLAKDLEVKVYGYDKDLKAIVFENGKLELPSSADGEETDIGSTLYEAIQRELGKRLACVILLGDGMQTAYQTMVDIHEPGRELDRQGVPLYTIAYGRADDGLQTKDIALERLPQDFTTYVKNDLQVSGMVRIRGYANQDIPVELEIVDKAGVRRIVDTTKVRVERSGDLANFTMQITPERTGDFTLIARAKLQPEEAIKENNELAVPLRVREGGLKVVYLYGGSLVGEQQELRRTINASPDMELDDQWVSIKGRGKWPLDWTRYFKDASYDVFIIEDVPADAFSKESLQALAEAVQAGKGLIMIGGYYSFGPGNYFDTPVADLLPVMMDRFDKQDISSVAPIREKLHIKANGNNLRMLPTQIHPVTLLSRPERNAAIWQQLPSLDGANRFGKLKSRARVLLESPAGAPLLVTSDYGGGRVLAFAGNSTWRWRRHGYGVQLKRFWRQIILWLARRDNRDEDEVWIELSQRRLNPATPLLFAVGARDSSGARIEDATFEVVLVPTKPAGDSKTLKIRLDDEGDYAGSIEDLRKPGEYEVRVTAKRGQKILGVNQAPFRVLDRKPEKTNAAADPDQFRRLAEMTKKWNGRPLAPEELNALLDELKRQPPQVDIDVETKWQLGGTPASAWPLFLLLAAALSGEWYLRKKWGLV